ncbi:Na/Pi cotransporter family protein [Rhizobiaceae bacterium n13]|uniref:Na/Pi cotransporter family protein n=1 Tax=Ferirhizobium litorale TaxID=2927786 RepID=A0AAE3U2V8_9HYPH|nr:Na/Pi cotransporter family protein [Fererhizobium litorale]MDI7863183.1 Na/Pi cotransporter family protein [Fererhizobium litorale]MDI7923082.1 Na/Pi cotransporter family protein [Fererhizobium litorale]
MTGSIVFLNLAGAVALLLWATRMVRTGVERAYGNLLREKLRLAVRNRATASIAGFLFAIALQSATAVALIISGFVASGYVSTAIGIAALLGADLGSAFVVRILRHDLSLLVPVLLLMGTVAFRASEARNWRQLGRIFIGLGLLLLSLRLIGEASDPLKQSELLPVIINYLSRDWITAFLLAALLAWVFHSSVATILLLASLADRHLLTPELIIPLVLGANFGAAIIGAVLTRNESRLARIVPLGNVAIRGTTTLCALVLQLVFKLSPDVFASDPGNAVVTVHIAINVIVVLLGLAFSSVVAGLLERLLPEPPSTEEPVPESRMSALAASDLQDPKQALANATREVLAVCDKIELMLTKIFEVFEKPDEQKMDRIEALDDEIDRIHRDIKFYLAKISQTKLDDRSAELCQDLLGATIKLEQAADIISQNMLIRARKKQGRKIEFSAEGWRELMEMHDEVTKNTRLAFNLLVNPDIENARQLVAQKEIVRNMVRLSEEKHLQRLRDGNIASYDSSSIHIDTMRDLKEINSLVVSIAYPVLESAGLLRQSRLV